MANSAVFGEVVAKMESGNMVTTEEIEAMAVLLGGNAETVRSIIANSLPAATMGAVTFYLFALTQAGRSD